jgi:hypothetical protein
MKGFSMKRWRGTQKIDLESTMNEKLQYGIIFIGHSLVTLIAFASAQ